MRTVPAGTVLSEDCPEENQPDGQLRTNHSGFAFLIDLEPGRRFSHPYRLAVLDDQGTLSAFDVDWPAFLDIPGESPTPFQTVARGDVNGPSFELVTGNGRPSEPVAGTPPPRSEEKPTETAATPTDCKKLALLMDLGDSGLTPENVNNPPPGPRERAVAEQFAKDAEAMRGFLEPNGFKITRVSQTPSSGRQLRSDLLFSDFVDQLQAQADQFGPCPTDRPCCGEFFLYLGGHGSERRDVPVPATPTSKAKPVSKGGLSIYSADGLRSREIAYDKLANALKKFPPCVKIIVFIDACHSSSAISELETLCAGRCGGTFVTSCSQQETSPGGLSSKSATQAFLERADEDRDNDGKFGDFTDRFRHMRDEMAKDRATSQARLCPGSTVMCSTD